MPADVRDSFGPVAENYASGSHADPELMDEVRALAEPRPDDVALDVATGAGNAAFAVAPHVRRVVGLDLTPQMLRLSRRRAAEKGLGNLDWVLGDAGALPFADETFDIYTVRSAPHHFPDLALTLREAWRVLTPGGRAVFVDCTPPEAARDLLHPIEVARDPSHHRSYTLEEWVAALAGVGFTVAAADVRELDWDFEDWMVRMAVPAERARELGGELERAAGAAREQLKPRRQADKLWHSYWHCRIRALKA